jgi:hypothetical protein
MADNTKRKILEEKLNFFYNKLLELDETEPEDYECMSYIKEQVGYYKKELLKEEEREFFSNMNKLFGIE